jgi:hypothetical protein
MCTECSLARGFAQGMAPKSKEKAKRSAKPKLSAEEKKEKEKDYRRRSAAHVNAMAALRWPGDLGFCMLHVRQCAFLRRSSLRLRRPFVSASCLRLCLI